MPVVFSSDGVQVLDNDKRREAIEVTAKALELRKWATENPHEAGLMSAAGDTWDRLWGLSEKARDLWKASGFSAPADARVLWEVSDE